MKKKKKCTGGEGIVIICGVVLTIVGFALIPPLINKYANKAYKASLKKEVIDFDNMGPEIVPYAKAGEE